MMGTTQDDEKKAGFLARHGHNAAANGIDWPKVRSMWYITATFVAIIKPKGLVTQDHWRLPPCPMQGERHGRSQHKARIVQCMAVMPTEQSRAAMKRITCMVTACEEHLSQHHEYCAYSTHTRDQLKRQQCTIQYTLPESLFLCNFNICRTIHSSGICTADAM